MSDGRAAEFRRAQQRARRAKGESFVVMLRREAGGTPEGEKGGIAVQSPP